PNESQPHQANQHTSRDEELPGGALCQWPGQTGYGVVNGAEERHTEGAYYLEWREGTKRVRVSLGKDAQDATARRLRKEAELNANNHGVSVTPTPSKNGHRQLSVAISEWLAEIKPDEEAQTLAAYTNGLEYFAESCTKQFVEDVERRDLLAFTAYLRD